MIPEEHIRLVKTWWDDPLGWCYTASEALYYLNGGKASGLKPMQARIEVDGKDVSHWWLIDEAGTIIDVTAEQFDFDFPYHLGRGRGFQTRMKGDTVELLEYLRDSLSILTVSGY